MSDAETSANDRRAHEHKHDEVVDMKNAAHADVGDNLVGYCDFIDDDLAEQTPDLDSTYDLAALHLSFQLIFDGV